MNYKKAAKFTAKTLLVGTFGALLGRYFTLDSEYRFQNQDGVKVVYSMSLDRSYPIITYDETVAVGTSNQIIHSLRARSNYEGKQELQPKIDELEEQVSDLEGKIILRQITDGIESAGRSMKNAWTNFKHDLIK